MRRTAVSSLVGALAGVVLGATHGAPAQLPARDGLPPGEYVAIVFRQPPRNFDPYAGDVLEQIRRTGLTFTLREAETHEIVLKIGGRAGTH